jgi:hypothetical protein
MTLIALLVIIFPVLVWSVCQTQINTLAKKVKELAAKDKTEWAYGAFSTKGQDCAPAAGSANHTNGASIVAREAKWREFVMNLSEMEG